MAAELDEAHLVRVQVQRERCQPPRQVAQEPLGLMPMLEADDDVIGIAHDDHVAGGRAPSLALGPQVEDVVQIDVRQQRRGHRSLRRAHLRLRPRPVFQHPGLQLFADQADDAAVAVPVLTNDGVRVD